MKIGEKNEKRFENDGENNCLEAVSGIKTKETKTGLPPENEK